MKLTYGDVEDDLQNADISYSAKYPVLLCLIVKNAHKRVQHDGVKETLRAKYWIVKGRSLIKSIIHQCVPCRRFEGKPFQRPLQLLYPLEMTQQTTGTTTTSTEPDGGVDDNTESSDESTLFEEPSVRR